MKMKLIRNINIKTKLVLLGAVSILGMVSLGTESILTSQRINEASTQISQSWVPSIIIAEELNTETSDYRIREYNHVIARDDETMDRMEKEMEQVRKEIEAAFTEYEHYTVNDADLQLVKEAKHYWQKYLKSSERLLSISRSNNTEEALEMIIGESKQLFDQSSNAFLKMAEFNRKGAEAASLWGDELYVRLVRTKVVMVLLICAIVMVLVIYIIVAIDKPIKDILEGTKRVANGDLDVYLPYHSSDEIGVVTDSLNKLIEWLRNVIEDEKYLLREIGSENFEVKSNCEQAYKGDFACILYSITGLISRLDAAEKRKEGKHTEEEQEIPSGLIEIKENDAPAAEVLREIKKHGKRDVDAADKKS